MFVVSVEHRPRNALVLVHPLSGNRSGKIYNETVAAIFRQANIETDVVGKGQDFTHFILVDKHLYTNSINSDGTIAEHKKGYSHNIFSYFPQNICCGYSLEAPR